MSPEADDYTNDVLEKLRAPVEEGSGAHVITIVSSGTDNVVQFVKYNTVSKADQAAIPADGEPRHTIPGSYVYTGLAPGLYGKSAVTGEFLRIEEIGGYEYVLFRPFVNGVLSDSIYETLLRYVERGAAKIRLVARDMLFS